MPTDDELDDLLDPARGFFLLEMYQEAGEELDKLPTEVRTSEPVRGMRFDVHRWLGEWSAARSLAESMAKELPEIAQWWVRWGFALQFEKSAAAALDVAREAIRLHPDVPDLHYNIACYSCLLGELDQARHHLAIAFELDPKFERIAAEDPDLEAIFRSPRIESGPGM